VEIHRLDADKLSSTQRDTWSRLQQSEPALASPFFRPEYTEAVAAVRDNVEVGILEERGKPVGFFPYQRHGRHFAQPVGGTLCDFQAVVAGKDVAFSPKLVLRGCGLTRWHFHHLVLSQEPFVPYHCIVEDSTYIDLADGFEAYRERQRQSGSREIKKILQKSRKLQRELDAPLRFVPYTTDEEVFETLVDWKSRQYARMKEVNYLAQDWTRNLLQRLLDRRTEDFSGVLSALYVGDTLAAVHLGIRSRGVLHAWFPTYNPNLANYSPGLIFWVELMQQCASLGIERIDLGKGDQRFKTSLKSGAVAVAEGSVHLSPVTQSIKRSWMHAREWIRSTPLRAPAGASARFLRRFQTWFAAH